MKLVDIKSNYALRNEVNHPLHSIGDDKDYFINSYTIIL